MNDKIIKDKMINEKPRPAARRTCQRCGQSINTQTDSWEMKHSEDGKYAQGVQHVTCPASSVLQEIHPVTAPTAVEAAPDRPVFVTMDEAAEMLRVSKATIRRRIRDGELPAKRLRGGQTVLIEQQHVLSLLEDIPPGSVI